MAVMLKEWRKVTIWNKDDDLMVAHFDLTIAKLGFTEAKGLGSSGYHEGQEDVEDRKSTRPWLRWIS